MSDLTERLRRYTEVLSVGGFQEDVPCEICIEAADALEAQEARIYNLEAESKAWKKLALDAIRNSSDFYQ